MAGIYIHVPFCYTRCSYCDFYKTTEQQFKGEYIKALCKEISINRSFLQEEDIRTLYFGGGTPSTLSASELKIILDKLFAYTSGNIIEELTLEINPDDVSDQYIKQLVSLGFNRLSMGVQSFFDAHLRKMNRRHNARQAHDAIRIARENGIDNMSIDLIYGLPYMTFDEWQSNVQQAIDSGVQHISAYHLTFEKGTLYYDYLKKGKLKEIPEETSVQQFEYLVEALERAGYINYEISNFALPGCESKHNSSYWSGQKYLGLGPSAHSFDGQNRSWNVRDIKRYCTAINDGAKYQEQELLDEVDRYNELIMLGLRVKNGFDLRLVESFNKEIVQYFNQQLHRQKVAGNVQIVEGFCCVAAGKKMITDGIIADFFYVNAE
ncbi:MULTISPECIES: radical SAM family heme chaperone HemW [unclassified Carboxylicivirga]|uniref:radical SAM family heme chaperone HemW n=1 Tax=Carboxylicivirga TaxID=1628153 RepID=UPI003D3547DB